MLKIVFTVVIVLFGLNAAHATYELGFALYGFPLAAFATLGMLWEIWIQPARDEAYRQRVLGDLGKGYPKGPINNLQDAQDLVAALEKRLDAVTGAYVDLKEQKDEA